MFTDSGLSYLENKLWKEAQNSQKELCLRLGIKYVAINPLDKIGIADNLNNIPFNGLRHPPENYSGWFLWSGEFKEKEDFFKPLHAIHLLEKLPNVVKYLGLAPGYRFLIDNSGYEDVWFDESLLLTNDGS